MNVTVDWLDPEAEALSERLRSTDIDWPNEMPLPVAGDRISFPDGAEEDRVNVKVGEGRVYRVRNGDVWLHLPCGAPGE